MAESLFRPKARYSPTNENFPRLTSSTSGFFSSCSSFTAGGKQKMVIKRRITNKPRAKYSFLSGNEAATSVWGKEERISLIIVIR